MLHSHQAQKYAFEWLLPEVSLGKGVYIGILGFLIQKPRVHEWLLKFFGLFSGFAYKTLGNWIHAKD